MPIWHILEPMHATLCSNLVSPPKFWVRFINSTASSPFKFLIYIPSFIDNLISISSNLSNLSINNL